MEGHGNERYETATDEEAMGAWQGGDADAFRELFQRWTPRLFSYFSVMSTESAMDLVQETWIKVVRGKDHFDPARPLKPWMFRIASRVRTDMFRSWAWKLRGLTARPNRDDAAGSVEPVDAVASTKPNPSVDAEKNELGTRLRNEVAGLREPWRQAIVLHDLEGLTCAETAEVMGVPTATVLTWVRRGRLALRTRLEAGGGMKPWT